jgi:ADP-heptose:LPS heptosyltransferase
MQMDNVEIHALTKKQYASMYANNPNIDKVHEWGEDNTTITNELKKQSFDYVIDLHRNIRTQKIKASLKQQSYTFPKLNIQKWLYVNFKYNKMPDVHIVDRYFEAVRPLGVKNDLKGLEFYMDESSHVDKQKLTKGENYICFAIGAQFTTKKMPVKKLAEIISNIDSTVVIIGGKEDVKEGEELCKTLPDKKIYNTCGEYSIEGSASIVKQAEALVTHDTGMMHIAAAYKTPIVSIWGNTVPEFGMYPYRPEDKSSYVIHEVKGLSCRPCSKIGYAKCPKKHFKCMMDQDVKSITNSISQLMKH